MTRWSKKVIFVPSCLGVSFILHFAKHVDSATGASGARVTVGQESTPGWVRVGQEGIRPAHMLLHEVSIFS